MEGPMAVWNDLECWKQTVMETWPEGRKLQHKRLKCAVLEVLSLLACETATDLLHTQDPTPQQQQDRVTAMAFLFRKGPLGSTEDSQVQPGCPRGSGFCPWSSFSVCEKSLFAAGQFPRAVAVSRVLGIK